MKFRPVPLLAVTWAFALWIGTTAVAAGPPGGEVPEAEAKAETFFNTAGLGDTAKAFDTLLDGSTISANRPEAASTLKRQFAAGLQVYGKPLGFDLVDRKAFGASLVRLVYIFKLEKYPLTFEFFFYRNGRGWQLIEVRFNDKLDVYRYEQIPAATPASP